MGSAPAIALDLVDTLKPGTEPETDTLGSADRNAAWWRLELPELPEASLPDVTAARRLRAAIRDLLESHLEGHQPRTASIDAVNAAAAAVPTSPWLVHASTGEPESRTRWHTEHGGNAALAAVAREAIDLLSAPERLNRLRRCANPTCSTLFLAETTRRRWCAGSVCGNRVRVARHYRRTRSA